MPLHIHTEQVSGLATVVASTDQIWANTPSSGTNFGHVTLNDGDGSRVLELTQSMPVDAAVALAERIDSLRVTFDLPVAWLARILGIERQTLYAWMRTSGAETTSPRQSSLDRLKRLEELNDKWRMLSTGRLTRGHAQLEYKSRSILDWLTKDLNSFHTVEAIRSAALANQAPGWLGPASQRLYRGPAHPDASRDQMLERSLVREPKE